MAAPSTTYDALVAAGASEEAARRASEQMAGYERRLDDMARDIAKLQEDLAATRETATTRAWVLGVMLLQTVAILGGFGGLLRLVLR